MADPCLRPMEWATVTEFGVAAETGQTWSENAVWFGTHGQDNYGTQGKDIWHTVDATVFGVPADARFIFLSGILIITKANPAGNADLRLYIRKFGSTDEPGVIGQTVIGPETGGQRSTMASWVTLNCGKFQFKYVLSTGPSGPPYITYGANLSIQMWAR